MANDNPEPRGRGRRRARKVGVLLPTETRRTYHGLFPPLSALHPVLSPNANMTLDQQHEALLSLRRSFALSAPPWNSGQYVRLVVGSPLAQA